MNKLFVEQNLSDLKKCCGVRMIELKGVHSLNQDIIDEWAFMCGKCGTILSVTKEALDDEVIINYIQNHEELKGTKIHKDLAKSFREELEVL